MKHAKKLLLIVSLMVIGSMLLGACKTAAPAEEAPAAEEAAPAEEAAAAEPAAAEAEGVAIPAEASKFMVDLPETLPDYCDPDEFVEGLAYAEKYWVNSLETTDDWVPNFRIAPKRYTIGYVEGLGGFPDSVAQTEGIVNAAKLACVDLVRCDSQYEIEPAINCAQVLADQGVDAVVNTNWQGPAMDAMKEIFDDAGIPQVTSDVAATGVPFFGVDNCSTGLAAAGYWADWLAANYTGDYSDVWVVHLENPDVGEEPEKRLSCAEDKMKELVPDIPEDHYVRIPGGSFTDEGYDSMTTWLTANPDAGLVLSSAINDNGAIGGSSACDSAGRNCVVIGKGASSQAWAELDKPDSESTFKATVDFVFFEYARYQLPAVFDLLEGKEIPSTIKNAVYVLDRDNMAEHEAVRPTE